MPSDRVSIAAAIVSDLAYAGLLSADETGRTISDLDPIAWRTRLRDARAVVSAALARTA